MKKLTDILGKEQLFFDGGTGTVLQGMGLKPGELPETWNVKHPDKIIELHYQYFSAGANIIKTNTFGAFVSKFPLELDRIITSAIENANIAREKVIQDKAIQDESVHNKTVDDKLMCDISIPDYYIAFDISSTGKLLKPLGDLDFEDCISLYKKTFRIALKCKIDCILIETMNDGYETKAAVIAAKEVMEELSQTEGSKVDYPIFVTNVYDKDSRTLSGSTPESMVAMLEGLGVAAIGVNCSLGPVEMLPTVQRLCQCANVPVIVNPNAGLPKVINGKTFFDITEEKFVQAMQQIFEIPSICTKILGGCCGTTPEYIKNLNAAITELSALKKSQKNDSAQTDFASQSDSQTDFASQSKLPQSDFSQSNLLQNNSTQNEYFEKSNFAKAQYTVISSNTRVVYFGISKPAVLIGERINPTGKKKFKEALRNNDIPYIIHQGMEQEAAGAEVLDVNVGLPEIDEKEMMVRVMTELQSVTDLPLQIDTTSKEVMESALRRYNGKPMINSVNGKQEIMNMIFPLVKKYGGLVVALTLDEDGIPTTSARRIEIANKIYTEAAKYGIDKKNIIIDPLAMAVSSDTKAAIATLETVKAIHESGGLTSLGISNVSFGLPNREFVTSTFFTMAMQNGLSAAIMNPLQLEMQKAYHTFNLLKGMDDNCTKYIGWASLPLAANAVVSSSSTTAFSATPSSGVIASQFDPATPQNGTLEYAIIHGLKADAAKATIELLKTTESLEIINNHLIPGLDFVGKHFEQKTMYLPQLLMAAEAAKAAFAEIRSFMEKSGKKGKSKGKIIIATVKGDIHDIGKNIVKVLLENYDFEVIDLGKDVPPETIVEACKKDKIQLVGLSALMTTTVASMEETIKQLRKECPWAKVCVGGAVMTQEYSDQIGADFYGKDAMDTVRYANEIFKN